MDPLKLLKPCNDVCERFFPLLSNMSQTERGKFGSIIIKSIVHTKQQPTVKIKQTLLGSDVILLTIVNIRFARRIILGLLICQFHSCASTSNLSSVGPPNSMTCKGPDKLRDDDATFDVLPS